MVAALVPNPSTPALSSRTRCPRRSLKSAPVCSANVFSMSTWSPSVKESSTARMRNSPGSFSSLFSPFGGFLRGVARPPLVARGVARRRPQAAVAPVLHVPPGRPDQYSRGRPPPVRGELVEPRARARPSTGSGRTVSVPFVVSLSNHVTRGTGTPLPGWVQGVPCLYRSTTTYGTLPNAVARSRRTPVERPEPHQEKEEPRGRRNQDHA